MNILITVVFILITNLSFATTYYVDATNGNDNNNGTSPSTAWKTIEKVNSSTFAPGDSVLFKRGESFRGSLVPSSGSPSGYITYGAYGTGNKPKLLGAYERSSSSDWTNQGGNIWRTKYRSVNLVEPELLPNPDFSSDLSGWEKWDDPATGASTVFSRTTAPGEYYTAPGGGKLVCTNHGNGSNPWGTDIQLFTSTGSVTALKWYRFSFKTKATQAFAIPHDKILLHNWALPGADYLPYSPASVSITNEWTSHEIFYKAKASSGSEGCRITFYLGNLIPNGCTLYIDSCSFRECEQDPEYITVDVGNIIFNNETSPGILVWNRFDLNAQGKFWYDEDNDLLEIYSTVNPGNYYSHIELCLNMRVIDITNKSYVICDNLDLRYGSFGVEGSNTHHIWIRDCDVSYIGGGNITGEHPPGRGGNGVQFWNGNHDNVVERCTFNQIYDSALSPQGLDSCEVYNIYFRNNIVTNCENSIEYWETNSATTAHDIYFENNTCLNAGDGWIHSQRPIQTQNGVQVMIWANLAKTWNVYIRNNIFYNATHYLVRWHRLEDVNTVIMDHNCWYQSSGSLAFIYLCDTIGILNITYNYATQWDAYRADTKQDLNSIHSDPLMNSDLTLQASSPCINAGITLNTVTDDFNGKARPQGSAYDIGAFEAESSTGIDYKVEKLDYLIFPNPTNARLSIVSTTSTCLMTIFSIEGKPLINLALQEGVNSIDLNNLKSGIYIIKLENSGNVIIRKLIKQ
jgi:hypothetical protein